MTEWHADEWHAWSGGRGRAAMPEATSRCMHMLAAGTDAACARARMAGQAAHGPDPQIVWNSAPR